jgi:hypothetical protein
MIDAARLLSAALIWKAASDKKSSNRLSVDRLLFIGSQLSIIIQPLRNPDKPEKTNYNIKRSNKIKPQLFEILNFGHCDLFGICVLLFEIF